MYRHAFLLALAISAIVLNTASASAGEPPKVKAIPWGLVHQRPGFATVDAFIEKLRLREDPWGELLMPDDIPEYENLKDFTDPERLVTTVIHRSKESAVVFA